MKGVPVPLSIHIKPFLFVYSYRHWWAPKTWSDHPLTTEILICWYIYYVCIHIKDYKYKFWAISLNSVIRVKYGPISKKGGWPSLIDRNFGMLVYITFLYISKTMYANFGPFLFVCTYGHWLAPKKGGWPPLNDRKFGLLIDIPFLHISKTMDMNFGLFL